MKSKYKDCFLNSMLAAVNRGMGVEGFQKEFNVKDAIYAAVKTWNTVDKDILAYAWHNLWLTSMFNDDDEQSNEFQGLCVTSEEKMKSDLLTYAKGISSDVINKLEEMDIEEVLNIDNEAP
ncbi:hypothetical protein scyTo_0007476 [Scyliorhinus torazame]|uniref:DDE-1 domain-containing protein n=1 Tax=Scyliorhinus torazame TaxID=75743 RepID=A0A401NT52_SCYTO|nr:hypothetical protein [Scyliorhinus torazame]